MAIKRYYAKKDNTITNAFKENLTTRGTGSNMGASDILEVFSIFGQANSSSAEESRVLIKFDCTASTNSIKADRDAGVIPASGNVTLFKAVQCPHSQTCQSPIRWMYLLFRAAGMRAQALIWKVIETSAPLTGSIESHLDQPGIMHGLQRAVTTSPILLHLFRPLSIQASDIELDITPLVEQWVNSAGNVLGSKGGCRSVLIE